MLMIFALYVLIKVLFINDCVRIILIYRLKFCTIVIGMHDNLFLLMNIL